VLVHRVGGQAGAVGPHVAEHVDLRVQPHAGLLERGAQLVGRGQAQHVAVHAHRVARQQTLGQPVEVVRGRAGGDLHQLDAAARELVLGLGPVAAVGEHGGAVLGHHQRAHRAGEARQPLPALPALGQVFGQMRVRRRHDDRRDAAALERSLDLLDAQAMGRGAGVHGRFYERGAGTAGCGSATTRACRS
jgi:hypothetical protein